MRPWAIPILGAVVLSLAAPSGADARPRFGPAAVFGVLAAPLMFAGSRHSFRYHRRSATRPSDDRRSDEVRAERRSGDARPAAAASVFWPDASADLIDYLFFPKGKDDRFWAYGYGTIVQAAFAVPDRNDVRALRGPSVASKDGDVASPAKESDGSAAADLCGIGAATGDAEALIGRSNRPSGRLRRSARSWNNYGLFWPRPSNGSKPLAPWPRLQLSRNDSRRSKIGSGRCAMPSLRFACRSRSSTTRSRTSSNGACTVVNRTCAGLERRSPTAAPQSALTRRDSGPFR